MPDNQRIPIPERKTYNIPTTWVAGDTIKWDVTISDYKASDGWSLTYEVKSKTANLSTITASADGDDFTVTVAASASASYSPGEYYYNAFVTKGSERYRVDEGAVTIEKDFQDSGNYDNRSHPEIVLDAIEAVLENRASKDQESYTIAGRSLARTSIPDLLVMRDRYKAEVVQAKRADRIARGLGSSATIKTRFI